MGVVRGVKHNVLKTFVLVDKGFPTLQQNHILVPYEMHQNLVPDKM